VAKWLSGLHFPEVEERRLLQRRVVVGGARADLAVAVGVAPVDAATTRQTLKSQL
jgi:hypothetical protein